MSKYPNSDQELTPLEMEVFEFYRNRIKATEIFEKSNFIKHCEPYQKELEKHNLLPDEETRKIRKIGYYTILLFLFGTGGYRLFMSLSAGKQNVWYLVGLMCLFGFVLYTLAHTNLTIKGKKFLKKLQGSIQISKSITNPDFATSSPSYSDALFLAAVMGGAYVTTEYVYAQELYPRTYTSSFHSDFGSSSSCSSSSSSCSSGDSGGGDSGGSSCSSGCGGGCGGGGD